MKKKLLLLCVALSAITIGVCSCKAWLVHYYDENRRGVSRREEEITGKGSPLYKECVHCVGIAPRHSNKP